MNLRTIAGRHAADRARAAAAADCSFDQTRARAELAARIRALGLLCFADLTQRPNVEPTISVNCRLDYCAEDEARIFATLDDAHWRIVTGRHNLYGHFLQLAHRICGAELLLIVKLPHAEVPRWEAA